MQIVDAAAYMPQIRELIAEYTAQLNLDLSFQQLDEELRDPAARYTPPNGCALIACEAGEALGMVAYHRCSPIRCEMKRLYVRPQARGRRIGVLLVEAILHRAEVDGYREMVLDTLAPMQAAIHLYRQYGFTECAPYYHNPLEDVIYMIRRWP